jgi:hypothetical protein
MHVSNLPILYLVPVLSLIWGIISLLRGTIDGQSNAFKSSFLWIIVSVMITFFISMVIGNNKVQTEHPELNQLFLMASGGLAFSAVIGLLYTNFQQFVPPIFIRMTLFFGVTAALLGVLTSFDTEDSIVATSTDTGSQFEQLEGKKSNF